ncbi:MAG: DUF938 domain-containing protein [Gammaproteobacteria bacterium]|jgi:cyclopropane fatty-acyl-phospholipid synthase-like methyltransferase|nr:DUF938 domain-containing protein [Gammaproteobacteria bacterium]MBT3725149.1 DUF938 domain-containing protein [Gammaproteobacteria bacterium]MBT4076443.1 DUF938 domain-containing protein [Gammaproteobacteria bacterium]MBT4193299.1 DUF938 domain-containing protein [Gammaproteobacteria bacterium]MBT4449241.1 DUF938 domain-containing protein [Gammaproteobacteria bacterium]
MLNKPYAESCDQNREPIQQVFEQFVDGRKTVLEIGSGTGQHAVYFSAQFADLLWQTSDLIENHSAIQAWIDDSGLNNVYSPIELDSRGDWPDQQYDLLYSANTVHIMSSGAVEQLFKKITGCMHENSVFLLYGPFNYDGLYTSESNARFDQWLKQRDSSSSIKNFNWLKDIGHQSGLKCIHDFEMPANNKLLVWRKD